MNQSIKSKEDLRWLLGHTGGFRGGYVTDVQMSKRRLFDEGSRREVLADTVVTVVIRYKIRQVVRVAKLTMGGVTDFSIFEQEGADCSTLSVIQAEATAGKLRFWFDPQGELYVVCDEASLDEVAVPFVEAAPFDRMQWTFQSEATDWPTVEWMLDELNQLSVPCAWRKAALKRGRHAVTQWEGNLLPLPARKVRGTKGLRVSLYGPCDGPGFGIALRVDDPKDRPACRILACLADRIAQRYAGQCLVGNTIIPGGEWQSWKASERTRWGAA